MKKFIETILNIYNIEELRGRIVTTLTLLLVYRLGAQVVLPGIDSVQLAELANRTDGGGLLGILNAFTGGLLPMLLFLRWELCHIFRLPLWSS